MDREIFRRNELLKPEQETPMVDVLMTAPHTPTRRHRHTRRKGQGIVEMALLTPMLIFMLLVTVDFARAYSAYIEVSNAARAGAIYGSRSSSNANNQVAVRDAALADSPNIFGSAPNVVSSTATDAGGYQQITVTVDYKFSILTGFPGIPSTIDLSRTVQMRVIG